MRSALSDIIEVFRYGFRAKDLIALAVLGGWIVAVVNIAAMIGG